jgi:hypothetical protein
LNASVNTHAGLQSTTDSKFIPIDISAAIIIRGSRVSTIGR